MIDEDRVACAPSTVYRVLKSAGLLQAWEVKASSKGPGFEQPTAVHEHWHIDIAYLNLGGTFYYLCSVLDGYSRVIVHGALRGDDDHGRGRAVGGPRAYSGRHPAHHLG
jgi:hypothetical protein